MESLSPYDSPWFYQDKSSISDLYNQFPQKNLSYNFSSSNPVLSYSFNGIRSRYWNGDIDFDTACSMIKNRREMTSSVFFSTDTETANGQPIEKFIRAKASIRGNDVYRARVWNRHKPLIRFCDVNDDISYIQQGLNGFTSGILKFTLTADISKFDMDEFNLFYCNYHYDHFVKRIRNLFPNVVLHKTLEVFTKKARGYFHINVIAIFPDNTFPVYHHTSRKKKNCKGEYVKTWRLQDYSKKELFNDLWDGGYVDTRAIESPRDAAEYSIKYAIKHFNDKNSSETQDLTLSTLSLFNKRAFSLPNGSVNRKSIGFFDALIEYTVGLDNPNPVLFPRLDIIKHNSLECKFIGHSIDFNGQYSPEIWFETLDHPPDEFATDDYMQLVAEAESKNMTVPEYIRFLGGNKE